MTTIPEEQIGEIPLELGADLDAELVEEFINDARERLENIEQGTLALEKNAHDQDVIHSLFRAFHTFKGNASFLDFTAVSQLAHMLESLLDGARENRLQINSIVIDVILKSRDTLKCFVDEIEAQITGKKPRQIVHIPTAVLKAAARHILSGVEAPLAKESPETTAVSGKKIAPAPVVNHDQPAKPKAAGYTNGTALHSVKVSTAKLDGLVDLAGELLIAQSLIVQNFSSPNVNRYTLGRNLDQLNRISKELQRTAMSMRMVPIRATFQKMHRLIRDISAHQQKEVQLFLQGEDTEVDRILVEKIGDPLMHMVRNAVDHAMELPAERVAKGKPAMGTIRLRAYHKSGNIVIEIEDDGMGINRERIYEKAIKNGMLKPGSKPDDKELLYLILQPGFSTAAVVTAISGRGVGMDVVQKNISRLRGKIDIKSVAGEGTTFTLRLPLTLAVIDGLIIRVGGQRYILPTVSVRESFHSKSGKITSLPGGVEVVQLRKEVIPLLRLRNHFELKGDSGAQSESVMVVIESDGKKRCLLADELVGKQEVVIKNLGEVFKTDPMVSGGAILGDGCVGLILDAAALVHLEPEASEVLSLNSHKKEAELSLA
jgi:two-component system, chemotaxis family, sensor kinase CheA